MNSDLDGPTPAKEEDSIEEQDAMEPAVGEEEKRGDIDGEQQVELIDTVPEGEDLAKTAPLLSLSEDPPVLATLVGATNPSVQLRYRSAFNCHIGAVRTRNEDSCFVFESDTGGQEPMAPFGLYIVADGMGGHFNGHEASRKVSRLVGWQVLERSYLNLLKSDTLGIEQEPLQEVLQSAVQAANLAIYTPNPDEDTGTTLTAALLLGRRLFLAHVGDSRAYLMENGELKQLTTDHTLVQKLQDAGQLTPEEAEQHHYRNVLYRAVGQGDDLEVDISTRPLPRRGKLLLCSDGLWGLVPQATMEEILQRDVSLSEMLDTLVGLALQAGGHDNITGIVIDFGPN